MEIRVRVARPIALDVRLRVEGLTVLLGPSGAGKTTLLRAITGLLPAKGTPWPGVPVERRPIGYMPQHYALFPHLSAVQNVEFPLAALRRDARRARALELLALVGVPQLADRRPRTLSGGEQQRVALARALAREPALLLLDEPTSNLDLPTREEVVEALLGVVGAVRVPTLVVTHDVELARVADRVAVLLDGRVRQAGAAAEVLHRPHDAAVARLVGVRGLHAGTVTAVHDGVLLLDTPLGAVRAPATREARVGDTVTWGVRPEHVRLRAARDTPLPADGNRIVVRAADATRTRALRRVSAVVDAGASGVTSGGANGGAPAELLVRGDGATAWGEGMVAEFDVADVVVVGG